LSSLRLFSRGYDQARILAEATARNLRLPAARLLKKTRHTRPQSSLASAAQRRKNASGAYCCIAPETARGKTVLVIDDIVTSGATMAECAAVLKAAGCTGVYAASAASR
jgi:predicted amidophosphoribosyltransferase